MKPYEFIKNTGIILFGISWLSLLIDGMIFESSQLTIFFTHWYFYFAAIIIFAEIIYWYFIELPPYKILYVNEKTFEEKTSALATAFAWIVGLQYASFLFKLIIPAIPGMLPWLGVVAIVILAVYIFFKFNSQKYIRHNERLDKKEKKKKRRKKK